MQDLNIMMEVLSWVGAIGSLVAYYSLTKEKITSQSNKYQAFNLINNCFFVCYNVYKTTYSFAFLSFLFAVIACQHLINNLDFEGYKEVIIAKFNR